MRLTYWLVALPALAACAGPNPAWLVTETDASSGGPGGGTSGSSASTSTSTGVPTTGGTSSTTGDPGTTGPATTGPDMTTDSSASTGVSGCGFVDGPDLDLTYSTSMPVGCDPAVLRQVHAEVLGQAGPNQWKFNICADEPACTDANATCGAGEQVVLTFGGPPELSPTFVPGECHQLHIVPRGEDPQDPQSCKLRLLRIAHTRFTPYATHYVGAIAVPGTASLPGMLDWFGLLGFSLSSLLDMPCTDEMGGCQPAPGGYVFKVNWGDPVVEYTVAEGASFDEQIVAADADQNLVEIGGTFTNVRARIDLARPCEAGRDFKWVWLAQLPAP